MGDHDVSVLVDAFLRDKPADKNIATLCLLAEEFYRHYHGRFVELCSTLQINSETIQPIIEGVANELFIDGIRWSKIVALFVFVKELSKNFDNLEEIERVISQWVSRYISPWVHDHGGWSNININTIF